jgi:hypothetical protein
MMDRAASKLATHNYVHESRNDKDCVLMLHCDRHLFVNCSANLY